MRVQEQIADSGGDEPIVERYLREVRKGVFFQGEKTQGSFKFMLNWYRSRLWLPRWSFRLVGLAVIVLSITLPVVAAFGQYLPDHALLVSVLAALIALLTSLSAFYRWDNVWQKYTETAMALEQLHNIWELAIAHAQTTPDATEGLRIARVATTRFISRVHQAVEVETKGYFSVQRFPGKGEHDEE